MATMLADADKIDPSLELSQRDRVAKVGLQPHVIEAATWRVGGCNPTWRGLQPHVTGAATPRDGGCNPT